MTSPWRITLPIEKAEQRADGLYLTGYASGPEVDGDGERVDSDAIVSFAAQINDAPEPLPYRDAHAKDGVLRDLGWLSRAWVNNQKRLGVEVRLDEENPAAQYLYRSINRGKKFGMSVAGVINAVAYEFVPELNRSVRTFKDVTLTEISNTTRPAWTPSFGTVLAKSIDEAAQAAESEGVTVMDDELTTDAQEQAPAAESAEVTEKAEEETAPVEEAVEETVAEGEAVEPEAETAEKAGRKFSNESAQRLISMYTEMGNALRELGVLEGESETPAEKSDSGDDAETLDKSTETAPADGQADLLTQVAELVKSVSELTAEVQALKTAERTVLPPVIDKADVDPVEDFQKSLATLDPSARLRAAFAAKHGDGIKA